MIYLASPYSHPDPLIRKARYEAVLDYYAEMIRQKKVVFCPIAMSHEVDVKLGLNDAWETYMIADQKIMAICDELLVLCLAGVEKSRGVTAEIAHAKELNIPIKYVHPEVSK